MALSARLPAALVQPPPPANRLDGDTGDEGTDIADFSPCRVGESNPHALAGSAV